MPLFKITFERLSEIVNIETMGKIKSRAKRDWLNQHHGKSRWIYKKGTAQVKLEDGSHWIAEVHFYTAHGKGRYLVEVKYLLERIYE